MATSDTHAAIRGDRGRRRARTGAEGDGARTRSGWRRWARTGGRRGRTGRAARLLAVSVLLHHGVPKPDGFYDPPGDVPSAPGVLLRGEPFTTAVPDEADGWRILYRTTRDDAGTSALASAIVLVARDVDDGPRPVIAWAHGTTGYVPGCAPTLLDDPFTAGAMPALREVVDRGWVLVATDYTGLGTEGPHPSLIGHREARSVLDAVRAARQLEPVSMADDSTVVWATHRAATPRCGREPSRTTTRPTYPDVDVDTYVRPAARVVAEEMSTRCLAEPSTLVSALSALVLDRPI